MVVFQSYFYICINRNGSKGQYKEPKLKNGRMERLKRDHILWKRKPHGVLVNVKKKQFLINLNFKNIDFSLKSDREQVKYILPTTSTIGCTRCHNTVHHRSNTVRVCTILICIWTRTRCRTRRRAPPIAPAATTEDLAVVHSVTSTTGTTAVTVS